MATDIKLDQQGGDWLIVEGRVLKTTASDFMLDSPGRRRGGPSPFRRALVHDAQDGLTINFGGDYPGGVTVTGNLVVTGDLKVAGTAVWCSHCRFAIGDRLASGHGRSRCNARQERCLHNPNTGRGRHSAVADEDGGRRR